MSEKYCKNCESRVGADHVCLTPEELKIADELGKRAEETIITQIGDFGFGRTREEAVRIWNHIKENT